MSHTRKIIATLNICAVGFGLILALILGGSFIGAGIDIIRNRPLPGHVIHHPSLGILLIAIGLGIMLGVPIGGFRVWAHRLRKKLK